MKPLIDYILSHTERGECQCGKCFDKGPDREAPQHSVDVFFFWVSAKGEPDKGTLRSLLEEHYPNPGRLRGGPSYIELGAELGSQEIALRLIGLGKLVGLWAVITPKTIGLDGPVAHQLAGQGFVTAGDFHLEAGLQLMAQESNQGEKGLGKEPTGSVPEAAE